MKTKTSNKVNIILIATTLLLLFVAVTSSLGKTSSWLSGSDEVTIEINVAGIEMSVKLQTTQLIDSNDDGEYEEDTVTSEDILQNGQISLGTQYIKANKEYFGIEDVEGETYKINKDITITYDEPGTGYYIRSKLIAKVNGVTYNITSFVTSDLLYRNDGWMYSVNADDENAAMTEGQTLSVIETFTFSQDFVNSLQGGLIKLYLNIEGSPTDFNVAE